LAEDIRRLLLEIDRDSPGAAAATPDCRPALDVLETAGAVEVVVDVPGVPAQSLRVAVRRNTLLVVGTKPAGPVDQKARFHLAERSSGRFARAVHVGGAFDASRAQARVRAGELRITLPLVQDRRGQVVMVVVERS
jgi:HSP20 family molecular chaperone IbpA